VETVDQWRARPVEGDLWAWEGVDEETRTHMQYRLRPMSADEDAALQNASLFLRQMAEDSPYQALVEETDGFLDAVALLEHVWAKDRTQWPTALRAAHGRFKSWLGALRAFDDHTQHLLSERLGRGSEPARGFKEALSAEYDRNLAYRASYALRNASEHASRVINDARMDARELQDGTTVYSVQLGLKGPELADRFTRLKAPIRAELRRIEETLDVVGVVHAAVGSCERAFATLLVLLKDPIVQACEVLETVHAEATRVGAKAALVMTTVLPDETVRLHRVDVQRARTARTILEQAQALLATTARVIGVEDLRQ
jgi:hypothetical protein